MTKSLTFQLNKKRKNSLAVKIFIISTISLQLAHWVVFTVLMSIEGIMMTFKNVNVYSNSEIWVGFSNYENLFRTIALDFSQKQGWYIALRNSMMYWPINFLIMLPMVIIMAYLMFSKVPGTKFFIVLFFIPTILPSVALVQIVKEMFAPEYGPINNLLMTLLGSTEPIAWFNSTKYSNIVLWGFSLWAGSGYFIVLLFGAFSRVPKEIVEAARIDGIGFFRELWSIYIPIIWPSITTVVVTGCVTVPFGMYMHQLLFTNGQAQTETIALRNFFMLAGGDYYASGTYSVVLSFISTPVALFAKWGMGKLHDSVEV